MTKEELYEKANDYVLAHVLSYWEGDFGRALDDLEAERWDSVMPWKPFEEFTGEEMIELILEWRNDLVKVFGND